MSTVRLTQQLSAHLSPIDVADLLFLILARRGASAIYLDPDEDLQTLSVEEGGGRRAILSLPDDLGRAVAARLALLGGLDVAGTVLQMGRVRIRAAAPAFDRAPFTEFLLVIDPTPRGVEVEIRRLVGRLDFIRRPDDTPLWEVQPTVAGRGNVYRISGEIGRGAAGIVYHGEHTALKRPVAIKVLNAKIASDPEMNARFAREARAASRARHRGIIDVTDFGTLADGRAFLVMELIDGRTLHSILRAGPLEPVRAVTIARQIAEALEVAHQAGVVHRDVKPSNILIDSEDRAKIGDFGAAKLLERESEVLSDTQRRVLSGTPFYMSPEHAQCMSTDRRTDVYALGCVLFEMISGRVPFQGKDVHEILNKQIHAPIPLLESPFGILPEIYQRLTLRSLAKSLEDRYQSAAEMKADLDCAALDPIVRDDSHGAKR